MTIRRTLGFLSLLILLTSCRIIQTVPEGGSIVSRTGMHDCAEGQTCIIDVNGTVFSDTFIAVAKPGYRFTGWGKGLCGGSLFPCALEDVPEDFTSKDVDTFLLPLFSPEQIPIIGSWSFLEYVDYEGATEDALDCGEDFVEGESFSVEALGGDNYQINWGDGGDATLAHIETVMGEGDVLTWGPITYADGVTEEYGWFLIQDGQLVFGEIGWSEPVDGDVCEATSVFCTGSYCKSWD
jgi:hypothetical protein